VVTGVYQVTVGKWDEIRHRVEQAKAFCEELGDYRQWGDSTVLLAEAALISGDVDYAMSMQHILLDDARRRRNPLQQCWGLFGVAANSIRRGEAATAIPMLEEALQILSELPNFASSVNTNAQLALANLRIGQQEKALAFAARVLELAMDISPTVYSLDIGFSAVAQVYFELWEKALRDQNVLTDAGPYKLLAEKALKLLRAFRNMFPIGQPYLAYYDGWYHWLTGKQQRSMRIWQAGLQPAQRLGLLYEEGLLRARLASHLPEGSAERNEHLQRARAIFEKMGAAHDLQLLRSSLGGA
jgi:tetratricopeptide (TPR) repeat protein